MIHPSIESLPPVVFGNRGVAFGRRVCVATGSPGFFDASDGGLADGSPKTCVDCGQCFSVRPLGRSSRELQNYQKHLEQLVEDRTAELLAANQNLQAKIEERGRMEEMLKNSEQKLMDVLRGFPIPQFVIDRNHKVVHWNKSLEQLSGIPADGIVGRSTHWRAFYAGARSCLCDLLVESNLEAIPVRYKDKCWKSPLLEGVYEGIDFFPDCGDGGKWLHFTATVIRDAKGAVTGAIETLQNVTEQRRTEIALAASQKASDAANRAKSEFLANMSHEIRTPMTAIMGYLDLLSEQCGENCPLVRSKEENPIEVVAKNAGHLLQIIDDVLDLSKIEVGRLVVERVPCSPGRILADVASLMRMRAGAKGLALNVQFSGPMPETIQSDPTRFRQILLNLIGNAVKFTHAGEVRVVTGLRPSAPEPVLQVQIIDTGIGMSAETLQGLFQPFSQADASTSRWFGGTGLGLAISRRLAQLLGGDVVADSELGLGSTFTFSTPVGSLDGVPIHENPAEILIGGLEKQSPAKAEIRLPPCRVLLVEDGLDNQRLFSLILRKAGGEVVIAKNGREAVESALASRTQGQPFDIVLMDMQMPVMDGYDAVRQLRAERWSGPIIALTAHAMSDDRRKCEEAGCDGYVTKPIDRSRFLRAVFDCLAAREAPAATTNARS